MKKLLTILCLGAFVVSTTNVSAQDDQKSLRTNTWSIYGQGGTSWATGLDYKNVHSSAGESIAPEMGVGVNYNLRPWIRFGLNYEFSKYKREQRFTEFQSMNYKPAIQTGELIESNGGMIYGDMWTWYHNVDLTAEFNIMELWVNRSSRRFNLYAGTGLGAMFAKGNTYTMGMGAEVWHDTSATNGDWTNTGWVKATNDRHHYQSAYMPFNLSAEYDVSPRLTLGVKGQYKCVFSSDDMAPDGLFATAFTIRYNFVPSCKQYYKDALYKRNNEYNDLINEARRTKAELEVAITDLNTENERLKKLLEECSESLDECEKYVRIKDLNVYFHLNDATVTRDEEARLAAFARELKADERFTINLVGEASAEGETLHNQELSEARLANVIKLLNQNGVGHDRIKSAKAVGSSKQIHDASGRKVEITVNR